MATKLEAMSLDHELETEESADSLAVCLAYLEREAREAGYSLTAHIVGVARESLETEYQNATIRHARGPEQAHIKVC